MEHRAHVCRRMLSPCSVLVFLMIAFFSPESASCSPLERRMKLHDVSKGSPISVLGYVTYRYDESNKFPFSYQENIAARNVSNKSVLLMVIHLEAAGTPGQDETYSQEYFFGGALKPGAIEVRDEPGASFGRAVNGIPLIDSGHDPHAIAKVRVEFVQFSGGSTWGDADSAKNVLDIRLRP